MSQRYSGKSRKDSSTMKKAKLSIKEKRKIKRENKKPERDLGILKKYHKKETKSVKKIFITLFLIFALVYIVKFLMGFF